MKAKSEGRRHPPAKRPACRRPGAGRWAGNEECRSGEKLGSGIRAQPLGCRRLRQLWRNRERRQIVESPVTVRREVLRTVYVRRVVEREGVSKCLTVRYLMSPGGCRKAAVHAATFSHFRHIEPSSGWVGHRLGEETAPCLGCPRRLPPEGGVPLPAPALRQAGGSREETAPCLAVRAREAGCRPGRLGLSRLLRRCTGLRASRWIKIGEEGPRFGSRALDPRRF